MVATSPALLATAIATVALAIAGCGGEPRRAATTTAPADAVTVAQPAITAHVSDPARAAYIRRADAVCGDLDPKREARLGEVDTAADPAEKYAETVSLATAQLRRIEAITPPAADRALIAQDVVERLRQRLRLRLRLKQDLATGDETAAARDQAQFEALGVAIRSFARGYGFKVCGTR